MPKKPQSPSPALEAALVYLLPEQQLILDELKLKFRRRGLKCSRSQLVRTALNLLGEQPLEKILARLDSETAA